MKKFTSLMLMLLCAVTAWAQNVVTSTEADPVYYVIGSYNRGGFLTNQGVGNGIVHVDLVDGSYWYFESAGDDGAVYFVNKLKDGENKIYLGGDLTASTTPAIWYVIENGVNTKGLSISKTATVTSYSCIDASNNSTGVGTWTPSASDWNGTTWAFVKCSDCFNATYNPNSLIFRTRSDRYVNTVGLGEETATVDQNYAGVNGRAYFDLTSSVTFEVFVGQEVTPAITRDGGWTNAYVYIDLAGDGFTASIGENGAPAEDLVSYSFYSGDEAGDTQGYNSKGDVLEGSSRNTIALPSFIAPAEAGTYRMRFKHDWNSIDPNGGNTNFNSNGGSFIDVTLIVKEMVPTATVNYSYQFNGVEKYTQASTGYVGEEYPALTETAKFPYGITATKPAGTIAESDIIDGVINKVVELTSTLPFEFAASVAAINKWYYIEMHSTNGYGKFLQYAETYIEWADATRTADEEDTYTWAFVGNPFDGIKLVNYGAPADANAVVSATDSGNPGFGAIADAVAWNVKASATNNDAQHFCFQYPSSSQYMNAQSGKIAFWGAADQGSTMWVTERDFTGATELQALIDQVDAAIAAYGEGGTTVGYYTAASVDALAAALTGAKAAIADPDRTAETNAAAQANLAAAVAALKTIQPEADVIYTIKNAYSGVYMNVSDGAGATVYNGDAALNEAFKFVPAGEEGKFYLYNIKRGKFLSTAPAHAGGQLQFAADLTDEAKTVAVANLGVANRVSITPAGGANVHHDSNYGTVVAWNGNANSRSAWVIEAVADPTTLALDLTIGEAGYATLYLGCNVTIPASVEAYVVESAEEGYVDLVQVEGVLPANTGVILKNEGTYTFTYSAETATVGTNLLLGTTTDANIDVEAYVLSKQSEGVGFYKAQMTDGTWLNNAHKVYLPVSAVTTSAASLSFRFPGTTGVEEVTTENGNVKAIYDLTGRRVEAITAPGIYIVNGVKRVVR